MRSVLLKFSDKLRTAYAEMGHVRARYAPLPCEISVGWIDPAVRSMVRDFKLPWEEYRTFESSETSGAELSHLTLKLETKTAMYVLYVKTENPITELLSRVATHFVV
ncbi:MAG: hypothetical protein ACPL3C_03375 [Pyrobaculum sp.]|uniref:hypothetical protein n=1 Tax=Pyrobaculum sp. TaxID=2004705 RepID=UPI003CA71804